jgi:CheY-like chemotaxis protein/HPt (histidine-containing phosphotransfer) domain-containing protein
MEVLKVERPPVSLPVDLHGLKTLVVDDSTTAREALVDLLESFTFNVSAVHSGPKAIEAFGRAATEDPYRLVLVDWKMPGMDGIETAQRIRALDCNESGTRNHDSRAPIIILVTAYGHEIIKAHIDKAAVDTLLLKPVKASQLFDIIMTLLGRAVVTVPLIKTKRAADLKRLAGRRVLVVEDNELNQDVAEAILGEAGLGVDTAENGRIAVDRVKESPRDYYDAILMDIQMPVMDGYEATKRIRAYELMAHGSELVAEGTIENGDQSTKPSAISHQPSASLKRVPIIALTAHALKGEEEKCLSADMDDYLSKPLDERDLYQVLLKWIAPLPAELDSAKRLPSHGTSNDRGVLDVQGALKRLGGRRQLYGKVLRKFESESAKADAIIARHIACNDMGAASRMAHTVKGTAAAIGAVNLSQVAGDLETAIQDNFPEMDDLLSVFKGELEKTLQSVKGFLETEHES